MRRTIVTLLLLTWFTPSVLLADGIYLGGSLGNASIDDTIPVSESVQDIDYKSDDTAYKLFIGMGIAQFAVETGYVNFGGTRNSGTDTAMTALDAFGMLHVGLGPLGVFGKVGFVRWDYDVNNIARSYKKDGTDVAYGLGAQFDLGSIAVRAEYELFDVGEVNDLYLFSVGVTVPF